VSEQAIIERLEREQYLDTEHPGSQWNAAMRRAIEIVRDERRKRLEREIGEFDFSDELTSTDERGGEGGL
jgi:hypothetical protein